MTDYDDETEDENPNDPCSKCGHIFGPHVLVATMHDPKLGGIILCPEPGCECYCTWSLKDQPMPYIPSDEAIDTLRRAAQTGELI